MATIEQLINQNIAAAESFRNSAAEALNEISRPKGPVGFSSLGIDPNQFDAFYRPPADDTTPMPVYEPPVGSQPTAPNLVTLHGIDTPVIPGSPTISTAGLFQQVMPSSNIPQFQATDPVLHTEEIYNALVAVGLPVLDKVVITPPKPLTIRDIPVINSPGYDPYTPLGELDSPRDYSRVYEQKFDDTLPRFKGFVEDVIDSFIGKYAPGYYDAMDQLRQAIDKGLNGSGLPEAYDDALYSRQQARISKEMGRAELAIIDDPNYRGFIVPPGKQQSAIDGLRVNAATTLAGASTDAFIEMRRAALQTYQFVLGLADGQVNGLRGMIGQFAGWAFDMIRVTQQHSQTIANFLITVFEYEAKRHEFSLSLMQALDAQFKITLEAALVDLTIYEAELKALSLRSDVDSRQLEAAKLQLEAQKIEVDKYSAIIDAIAKRAVGDELKIKEFGLKADVFDTQIKGVLAGFQAYEAAIGGDKAKLDGELAKLTVFQEQLKGINLQLDAQKSVQEGDIATNKANLDVFTTKQNAYETSAKIALAKFSAGAEVKKLAMELYGTNAEINMEVFKAELQKDIAIQDSIIAAFRGNIESLGHFYDLKRSYAELQLRSQEVIASGFSNIASAASQANSAVLSLAASG